MSELARGVAIVLALLVLAVVGERMAAEDALSRSPPAAVAR